MDQLVNLVVERTGISTDQANQAVQTVLGFLKDRLPGPLAGQLDSVLSGSPDLGGMADQMKQGFGGLGGMLGGNQE